MPDQNTLTTVAGVVGLAVVITVGYWWIARSRADARGEFGDKADQRLDALRAAYESGQMDTAEFERVQRSIEKTAPTRTPSRIAGGDKADARMQALRAAYEAGQMDAAEFERARQSIEPSRSEQTGTTPPVALQRDVESTSASAPRAEPPSPAD